MKKNLRGLRVYGVVGVASLLAVGGGIVASTTASASVSPNNARVALAGTQTGLGDAKALQKAAPALPARITANVYLADRNTAALTAFAQAVSTPGTAQYHHYLTAAQAKAAFAPTAAEAQSVEGWAASNALQVGAVTSGFGAYVQVTGTASAIAHAFGVKFGSYQVGAKKHAQRFWAPEQAASVPASIRGDVLTVTGLDSAKHQATPGEALPPPAAELLRRAVVLGLLRPEGRRRAVRHGGGHHDEDPDRERPGPALDQHRLHPGPGPRRVQRRQVGRDRQGRDGRDHRRLHPADPAGRTPTSTRSGRPASPAATRRWTRRSRRASSRSSSTPGRPPMTTPSAAECGASGWYGESTLDVESVHGMAPNANVTYIGASDCTDQGLGNAVAYVVNTHAASIVTDSWGEPVRHVVAGPVYDQLFKAGATEGIGFFFSAGDSGYEDPNYEDATDQVQVDYPDLEPVGDLGRRHQPRDRQERELRGRDLLGHLPQPADRQLQGQEQLDLRRRPTPATRS